MGQELQEQRAWFVECLRHAGVSEFDATEIARRCPYGLCKSAAHDMHGRCLRTEEYRREAERKAGVS